MILISPTQLVFNWKRSLSTPQILNYFGMLSGDYCGSFYKGKYLFYQVLQDLLIEI